MELLTGATGLGKTRYVFHMHDPEDIWVWPGDRWFDGYTGQPVALFDDFRGELDLGNMLRLLDRYPMDVPVKGGFANWVPRRIYITSNVLPAVWWPDLDREKLEPFWRRVDKYHLITSDIFKD